MKKVSYNSDFLKLLGELSLINSKFLILKNEDDKLQIDCKNDSKSIAYRLVCPLNNFNFDSDSLGFYHYPQFYNLLKSFNKPELVHDNDKLVIKENKSKVTYYLADTDMFEETFKNLKFEDPDYTVTFDTEQLKNLNKKINLVQSAFIEFVFKKDKGAFKLLTDLKKNSKSNTYEEMVDVTRNDSELEYFEITLKTDIFTQLPNGNFKVNFKKEGLVQFKYLNDNVELNLYVGEVESE